MIRRIHAIAALTALSSLAALAAGATDEPVPAADEVLARAVAYHDPNGVWGTGALRISERFELSGETLERLGFDRIDSEILIDHEKNAFRCTTRTSGGDLIEYVVTGDEGEVRLNGSAYAPGDHPLLRRPSAEEAPRHRNLDVYTFGLPMKLRDAGTRVDPEVHVEEVRGRPAYRIDVSYPGGGHSWRFHFAAETGALVRGRFYTAGGSLDEGEWFDAEGEIETTDGLRIPSKRTWYHSGEDALIGTQEILALERVDALPAQPERSAARPEPPAGVPAPVHVDTAAVEWRPAAALGFPEGMLRKRLHSNPENGAAAALARHPKGHVEPRHYHTTANHGIYILAGRLRYEDVEAGPGEFFYAPAGHAHGPIEALEDVEFLLWTDGPLDLHLGDPVNAAEAPQEQNLVAGEASSAAATAAAPAGLAPGSNEMLRAHITAAPDLEVLISDVIIPPHSQVPRHYHPGEEFVYVIEGSAIHVEEGKPDRLTRAGDAMVIPPGAVHSPRGGPQGARAVVFRVHLAGEPERISVDE